MNYFNYFSEIEELFIRRRGRNLLLSPLDWALIESWQEREVPLHIVLSGIEKIFDSADGQPAPRKRTVKSLLYCKEEIEAQYAEWLERQVGKNGNGQKVPSAESQVLSPKSEISAPSTRHSALKTQDSGLFPDNAIAAHLERVSLELKSAAAKAENGLSATLKKVANHLAELKEKSNTTEKLEESLERLDALIDERLLLSFETETLKCEIEKEIAAYKNKMEREVYRRTFDLMLLKRLRERAAIPRLSLFYL
jgi:hypothetical protein